MPDVYIIQGYIGAEGRANINLFPADNIDDAASHRILCYWR